MELEHRVSIHKGYEINLDARAYNIDILGGWGLSWGSFQFHSGINLQVKSLFGKKWSFQFNQPHLAEEPNGFSKHITTHGTSKVEFANPTSLEVKESNLFFAGLFQTNI